MKLLKNDSSGFYSHEFPGFDKQIPDSPQDESDFLPEFCHYKDEGCDLAPSCLDCALPECKEDRLISTKLTQKRRDAEIIKLHLNEKKSFQELASQFHLTRRRIIKIIVGCRKGKQQRKNSPISPFSKGEGLGSEINC
jgi:hypothetical protein